MADILGNSISKRFFQDIYEYVYIQKIYVWLWALLNVFLKLFGDTIAIIIIVLVTLIMIELGP